MILLACGEFKSKVYPIWYAQRFEGVDNFGTSRKLSRKWSELDKLLQNQ